MKLVALFVVFPFLANAQTTPAQGNTKSGMFRYMADAPVFFDCQTRERLPVAMEGQYLALESAYTKTGRPGEEMMVEVAARVSNRPNADGGKPTPTFVIDRYIGIWPGERCGNPGATSPLRNTYWKLTRLDGKPNILAEQQREPNMILRTEQNRVTGYGGCNNFSGTYELDGSKITLQPDGIYHDGLRAGMDIETVFPKTLSAVRTWKITGEHLELYDLNSKLVARFQAVAPK